MKNQALHTNDWDTIQLCIDGNAPAQKELYQKYAKAMFHTIARMIGNVPESEDLLQESFIKVFQNLKNFEGKSSIGAWIKRICVNTAIQQIKLNKRLVIEPIDQFNELQTESNEDDIEFDVAAIHTAVKSLPEGSRVILSLYLFEGFKHHEIGEILKISESTSKTQYRRGKELLKKRLKSMGYGK